MEITVEPWYLIFKLETTSLTCQCVAASRLRKVQEGCKDMGSIGQRHEMHLLPSTAIFSASILTHPRSSLLLPNRPGSILPTEAGPQ